MKSTHKILILHDLCTTGKAALMNMLPVFSAMQMEACPLPTMLLSMPTGGFRAPITHSIPLAYIQTCVDQYVAEKIEFSAIFVGYLGNENMAMAAQYLIQHFPEVPIFFDPIMGDSGHYYSNFGSAYRDLLLPLTKHTHIMFPNITELCLLSQRKYQDTHTKEELVAMCQQFETPIIVITGVCTKQGMQGVALWKDETLELIALKYEAENYHGTGDVFAAVVVSYYLHGHTLSDCIELAHDFVRQCIRRSTAMNENKREGVRLEQCLKLLLHDTK